MDGAESPAKYQDLLREFPGVLDSSHFFFFLPWIPLVVVKPIDSFLE